MDELVHLVPDGPEFIEHEPEGLSCWCNPQPLEFETKVIIHFEPEIAGH